MCTKPKLLLLVGFLALLSGPNSAQDAETPAALQPPAAPESTVAGAGSQFDAFTNGLHSFSANFKQLVFDSNGQQEEFSEGVFYLQQPNLMHWKYEHPYPQLIVADGSTLWSWDVELEQITRREQSIAEQQSPLTLLTDPERLQQAFSLVELGTDADNIAWMQLLPKTQISATGEDQLAGFSRILVAMQDGLLQRMVLEDTLGQRTEVVFSGMVKNPELSAELFSFDPPAGIDVLEG